MPGDDWDQNTTSPSLTVAVASSCGDNWGITDLPAAVPNPSVWVDDIMKYFFPLLPVILLVGFIGNLLTIVIFLANKHLRKPVNYLILNLAVADLLSCCVVTWAKTNQAFQVAANLAAHNRYFCIMPQWAAISIAEGSMGAILCISVDRVIAVTWPLQHMAKMSVRKVLIGISFVWLAILTVTTVPHVGFSTWQPGEHCYVWLILPGAYLQSMYNIFAAALLVLMAVPNIYVAAVAWRQQKKKTFRTMRNNPGGNDTPMQHKALKKQQRITIMLLKMVGSFYFLWVPFLITGSIMLTDVLANKVPSRSMALLHEVMAIIAGLSFVTNPIIWARENKDTRVAYKKAFGCK
jgi:hypothetical protein